MTDITEKLNADRAIRVWAVEQAQNPTYSIHDGSYLKPITAEGVIDRAAKLEQYVLNGGSKAGASVAVPEFELVDPEFEDVDDE